MVEAVLGEPVRLPSVEVLSGSRGSMPASEWVARSEDAEVFSPRWWRTGGGNWGCVLWLFWVPFLAAARLYGMPMIHCARLIEARRLLERGDAEGARKMRLRGAIDLCIIVVLYILCAFIVCFHVRACLEGAP